MLLTRFAAALAFAFALAPLSLAAAPRGAPPATPKHPVTDTYHGQAVVDDYRWLEDWADPKVKAWSAAQNKVARAHLDKLPGVAALRKRVTQIMSAQTVRYRHLSYVGHTLFAMKTEPPKQQPFLVVLPDADHPAGGRVVVDPNTLDLATVPTRAKRARPAEGGAPGGAAPPRAIVRRPAGRRHLSIDWFVPSPDGKLVAVSLSSGGSESGDVHVFDVATGRDLDDTVPRVNGGTAGGSLAWAPDAKGFFYSRYPRGTERPAEDMAFYTRIFFHTLGTPTASDRYELGDAFPRIAEIQLLTQPGGGHVLANVQNGDGGEFAVYLRAPGGGWTQFADYPDRIVQAAFGPRNTLFIFSLHGAPNGKVLRLSLDKPTLAEARLIVPEGKDALVTDFWDNTVLAVTPNRLFLTYQLGGPSEIRVFDHEGKPQPAPAQPPVAAAEGLTALEGDQVLFQVQSYIDPPAWYFHDASAVAAGAAARKTALAVKPPVDFADAEVVRELATSKDGTKIPVNIIRRKGIALDGSHPTLVTAYGGYAVSMTPGFAAPDRVLVEQGFVIAEANIRGGAEFGMEWHAAGRLLKKQNTFDDFAAAVRHMTEAGYTRPERTLITGGSNGGLTMAATFVQHPEICHAVVSHVGIYDTLRNELTSNGAFNVPEYGTVKDPAQFAVLHAISPYHHVQDGTRYPDVLLLTGANDPRVDPMQSRKLTARLQAASKNSLTLLRTSASSGHGLDTALSERIEEKVDVFAFMLTEAGVKYVPVKSPQAPR